MYSQKTESLVYEEDDSDGIVEYGSDSDEHVDLEDVSDNDNDASSDDVPRDCQVKHKKRVASRSSEEPYADNRKAKKRKLSTSNEDETTDSESGAAGQEGLNDSAWGMSYICLIYLRGGGVRVEQEGADSGFSGSGRWECRCARMTSLYMHDGSLGKYGQDRTIVDLNIFKGDRKNYVHIMYVKRFLNTPFTKIASDDQYKFILIKYV